MNARSKNGLVSRSCIGRRDDSMGDHPGVSFLTPTFSNHWGNWLFVVMAFFIGFLPVSVFAEPITVKGQYSSAAAAQSACNTWGALNPATGGDYYNFQCNIQTYHSATERAQQISVYYSNDVIKERFRWTYQISGGCPVGTLELNGQCFPDPGCPASGTEKVLAVPAKTPEELAATGPAVFYPSTVYLFDSCGYTKKPVPDGEDPPETQCYFAPDDNQIERIWCKYTFIATGTIANQAAGMPAAEPKEVDGEDPDISVASEDTTNQGVAESSSETVVSEPTETLPDGTTVDQKTEVATEVKNTGIQTETSTQTETVQWSEGIVKTTTTTTTTTTNPDGSKTVDTVQSVAYQQTDGALMITENDSGVRTITHNPGYGGSKTTTTSTSYDSEGNKTGSTSSTSSQNSTSTNSGAGEAESDFESTTFCEDNPDNPACKDYDGPSVDGEYTPGSLTYDGVIGDFKTRIQASEFYGASAGFFDISIPASSCPTWSGSIPLLGLTTIDINFDFFCKPETAAFLALIAVIVMFGASWLAFMIAIVW